MKKIAVALALMVAFGYSGQRAIDWKHRGFTPSPEPIDLFAEELRATIPENARVLVVAPRQSRWNRSANLLSAKLHPRLLVHEGPADWIVEGVRRVRAGS